MSEQNPQPNTSVNSQNIVLNYNDPYFLCSADTSNQSIIAIVFNGSNYVNWSRAMKMALIARNKQGFIDGTLPKPSPPSTDLQKWIRNDHVVLSWIINSIDKTLVESFIFIDTAFELWKEIKERYGQSNLPQLFDLHRSLFFMEQHDDSVASYYCKKKRVWDELQSLEGVPDCSCGAISNCSCGILHKFVEADNKMKLIQFLSGINPSYDQVKVNILSMDPPPTLNRAYQILQQVERQNHNSSSATNTSSVSAFQVHSGNASKFQANKRDFKRPKLERFCDNCKKKGHTIDQCFKLIGAPEWYLNRMTNTKGGSKPIGSVKSNNVLAANVHSDDAGILGANPSEVSMASHSSCPLDQNMISAVCKEVMKAMQQQSNHILPSDPLSGTHSAINFAGTVLASNVHPSIQFLDVNCWIVDSGASDHICYNSKLFTSMTLLPQSIPVKLPNGSVIPVTHVGAIPITPEIMLERVLFVPLFKHNLLSVARLVSDHKLVVHFTE